MAEGIIKRWDTQLDSRVCPVCAPLEGMTRPLGEPFPGGFEHPPAHPSCRCLVRHFSDTTLEPRPGAGPSR